MPSEYKAESCRLTTLMLETCVRLLEQFHVLFNVVVGFGQVVRIPFAAMLFVEVSRINMQGARQIARRVRHRVDNIRAELAGIFWSK